MCQCVYSHFCKFSWVIFCKIIYDTMFEKKCASFHFCTIVQCRKCKKRLFVCIRVAFCGTVLPIFRDDLSIVCVFSAKRYSSIVLKKLVLYFWGKLWSRWAADDFTLVIICQGGRGSLLIWGRRSHCWQMQ